MGEMGDMEIRWNPWHGCFKCSEGCLRCYLFENDKQLGINSNFIKINRTEFRLPVQKKREKNRRLEKYELQYKVKSGSTIIVCSTSDFFLEEADFMRAEAWKFIHERYDCLFHIITKRPERIQQTLPELWLEGWDNVMISVSVENENRAYERIPILLDLPIKHKGIVIEPMLEQMNIKPYLSSGEIEQVIVGGESYAGWEGLARELKLSWVRDINDQCKQYNTNCIFSQTGTRLRADNGQIINIHRRDERGLAEFYKLNYFDESIENWESKLEEIELQHTTEEAYKIYKKILENKSSS